MKTQFKVTSNTNWYGYEATNGNRKVEVVRCYQGDWAVFEYVDGKQVVTGHNKSYSYRQAMQVARETLNG